MRSMSSDYAYIKEWRQKSKKNARYNTSYMRERRKHYRSLYVAGKIAYADIPKSYRYFTNSLSS
jgi:hypothetical protein